MAPITTQELHLFHTKERNLLICLLYTLGRDPTQSLLILALWLWLEHAAHPNFVPQISALNPNLINAMANEALLCLNCLQHSHADDPATHCSASVPLTATLTQMNLTLLIFNRRRFTILAGIKSVLNNICSRIFTDILSHVFRIAGSRRGASLPGPLTPVVVPGFPHSLYGPFKPSRLEWDLNDERLWCNWRWKPSNDVSDDDKTMFLTFSRGFPVTEEEVSYLFRTVFGEKSVVQIYMGNLLEEDHHLLQQEHSLYATMLVDSVATVDRILKGRRIAKYRINGKHIWSRKYERRE